MLKQLYGRSSVEEEFVNELEQYKAYKAIAVGGDISLSYANGETAMEIGKNYKENESVYFYNDFKDVTLNGANSIQLLNNELSNETVSKIQFIAKEALELDKDNKPIPRDLSNSVLFINIDAIRGYLVSIDGDYGIYKYETSDDVTAKIRYLALDSQIDNTDTNQYILVNYYTTN